MRITMPKLLLLIVFVAVAMTMWADVDEYTFTSALGTYTEISGGTLLGDNTNTNQGFNDIPFTYKYELESLQNYGTQSDFIILEPQTVSADDNPVLETALKGLYPSPLNHSSIIKFEETVYNTQITLTIPIFNGQKIHSLVDAYIDKGFHTVIWNGTDDMGRELSSGIYLLKFSANNHNKSM